MLQRFSAALRAPLKKESGNFARSVQAFQDLSQSQATISNIRRPLNGLKLERPPTTEELAEFQESLHPPQHRAASGRNRSQKGVCAPGSVSAGTAGTIAQVQVGGTGTAGGSSASSAKPGSPGFSLAKQHREALERFASGPVGGGAGHRPASYGAQPVPGYGAKFMQMRDWALARSAAAGCGQQQSGRNLHSRSGAGAGADEVEDSKTGGVDR